MSELSISIPEFALVVLIGASGSGKSTFARAHFKPTEVINSDYCRALVSDNENDQTATPHAFDVMHYIAAKRLAGMRLTVLDATNVQPESRKPWIQLAKEYHCLPIAIVFDIPERLCREHNRQRTDRNVPNYVIENQSRDLRRSLRSLEREGFRYVHILSSEEQVKNVALTREPLYNNRRSDHGPFDIIGDVHGCFDELSALLLNLGYSLSERESEFQIEPPPGHRVIFLGDLVDRGPKIVPVLRLVMGMVSVGTALCVPGNHDIKLMRALQGRKVQISHGLQESLAQLEGESPEFRNRIVEFIHDLVSHYVLDDGKLVVAHAGMKAELQGRTSPAVRDFALFGETTGETDEFGLPVRYPWANDYRGAAMVVYGHTPVPKPEWLNRTINIDTGCVFGGALTALRYPSAELVSMPANRVYAEPSRPFLIQDASTATLQQQADDVLDIADVAGKRIIGTRLYSNVHIGDGNAAAALEVMSRFAVDPRWLIYLPPTMSPSETSHIPDLLEHPSEAFAYFRHHGVTEVVCEEKHMGSRLIVIVCRDAQAARRRFGALEGEGGVCFTRTGRRFFTNTASELEFLSRLRNAVSAARLWDEFATDWICLDCEIMPWSAKAQELLQNQYAAVGAAARASLPQAVAAVAQAAAHADVAALQDQLREREAMLNSYIHAYRRYCWPVHSINDLKLAPFHLLATEGHVYIDQNHLWHMQMLARLAVDEPLVVTTSHRRVILEDADSQAEAIHWWEELTGRGGEGIVVKPLEFIVHGRHGLVQPAIKCRGREYLRIIYGPEYTIPENLARLRERGLTAKRSLALREFALGIEALERFVRREPLRHVHECVFGVLALESEPVDPRL